MVEKARRTRRDHDERDDGLREWEVFVRDDRSDPMRHVGSVSAPDADSAHDHASRLFAWFANDVWLCPSEEMRRYSAHDLGEEDAEPAVPAEDDEPRTHEL